MALNPTYPESGRNWPRRRGPMSEEEYHELEKLNPDCKYEYIDGVAYMMSGGTVEHDLIADNIRAALRSRLRVRSGSCNTFGENVQVLMEIKRNGKKHYVYPDVTVSCAAEDRRPGNTMIESPKIVIEVLSPGTEAKDRSIKFRAFQKCPTIQEIVLVDQFAPYIQIWQRDEQDPASWHYRHYGPGEVVEFASVDIHVEIEELYLDVAFPMEPVEDDENEADEDDE